MIRIDALWLAVKPVDMRAGPERLLATRVEVFRCSSADSVFLVDCRGYPHRRWQLPARLHRAVSPAHPAGLGMPQCWLHRRP